jgi:hypothetical protein
MNSDWRETESGNWVLIEGEELEATVYRTGASWGAVWNGAADGRSRRMKQKCDDPETAMSSVETAIAEGKDSLRWLPPDQQWQPTKMGGWYRKLNGLIVSVKQAKSGSWYVGNSAGGFLGKEGRTTWFSTDKQARDAADAIAAGGGDWGWISLRAA